MEKVTNTKRKNQKALQGKKRCQMCGNMLRLSKFADHQARRCRFKYLRGTVYETLPEGVRWRQHLPWLSHVSGSPRREGNPPLIAPGREVPQWLRDIETAGELPLSLPLHDILAASCFYPASGIDDTSPILLANGYVHSFVYADYGIKREVEELELVKKSAESPIKSTHEASGKSRESVLKPVEINLPLPFRN